MRNCIIGLLMATLFLSGCAHTTSSSYLNASYNNGSSAFENILGFGLVAAATTGVILAAANSDYDDKGHHENPYTNKHNNKHQGYRGIKSRKI